MKNDLNLPELSLYEVSRKVYPRAVRGWFAAWRWALVWATQLAFYGGAWLTWNDRQAILFDIAHRKFYIFGLVFWPQDIIYLAVLLIISALSLFLFTAVAGRLWCGYACPQTVYTEIFLWIERLIEGDRNARIRLDKQGLSQRKFLLKGAKHAVWIALSLWTGFTFVGYFTPIRELLALQLGPWEAFWVLFYGFATYGNAGWMREQVCKYMCPYARFQGAMFDPATLIIAYDAARGEPRGSRRKGSDYKGAGLGDCIDCTFCVQVCPTGIDIRDGLQYECIACGACIDACDAVMDKVAYPRGLIRYATEDSLAGRPSRVLRPRVVVYFVMLAAGFVAFAWSVTHRLPLLVDVVRDRNALYRVASDGAIENAYTLKIMNKGDESRRFRVTLDDAGPIALAGGAAIEAAVASGEVLALPVTLRAPAGAVRGRAEFEFAVAAADEPEIRYEAESRFFGPSP
jgi:cytochrome c oxidase accessory protein FixG